MRVYLKYKVVNIVISIIKVIFNDLILNGFEGYKINIVCIKFEYINYFYIDSIFSS